MVGILFPGKIQRLLQDRVWRRSSSADDSEAITLEGYIPYSTLTRMADNVLDITWFYASSKNEENADEAEKALRTSCWNDLKEMLCFKRLSL